MNPNNPSWYENFEARPHPWPALNWLTPIIVVKNVDEALAFYQKFILDLLCIFQMKDDSNTETLFARMRYRGSNFCLNKEGFDIEGQVPSSGSPLPFAFYLYVDDFYKVYNNMLLTGAVEVFKPRNEFWGDIRARFQDPFGYFWDVAQKLPSDLNNT
jgi:PhnB protein